MEASFKSIRPFIGSKDFEVSRSFYRDLGFTEMRIGDTFSVFEKGTLAFYLQDAYVKDWVDNSMVFLEVDDVHKYYEELVAMALPQRYQGVKLSTIQHFHWGKECFLHDPSGILWHIGEFNK